MPDLYLFGSFELDAAELRLTSGGQPVALTGRALDTLLVLVRNPGRLVTRDELLTAVWGETIVEEGNLHWTISLVRRALGQGSQGAGESWIETVRGRGYRFLAPVEAVARDPAPASPGPEPVVPPAPHRPRVAFRWPTAAAAALVLLSLAAAKPGGPQAQKLYAEGLERMQRMEVMGAVESLRAAVAADPDLPGGWLALARAYDLLGSSRLAEDAALQARERSQGLPEGQKLAIEAAYLSITRRHGEAARLLRRAYELSHHRLDDGLTLLETLIQARQASEARALLIELRREQAAATDARLLLSDALIFELQEDYAGSLPAAEKALAAARRQGMAEIEIRALGLLAISRIRAGTTAACGRSADDVAVARRRAEGLGHRFLLARALQTQGNLLSECRPGTAEQEKVEQEAVAIYRDLGALGKTAPLLYNLGGIRLDEGDLLGADRLMREAFETCRAHGLACEERFLHPLGVNRLHRGELGEARRLIEEGLLRNREKGNRRRMAEAMSFLPDIAAWSGDLTRAVELQHQVLALRQEIGLPEGIAWAHSDTAFWLAEAGHGAEAREEARRAVALAQKQGEISLEAFARTGLASAHLGLGDLAAADRESARALALLAPPRLPIASFPVWRVRARVLLARGKLDAAEALIEEGLRLARAGGFVAYELDGRLLRARLTLARGRRSEARELAADLAAEARAKGFGLIAERCAAIGGRIDRSAPPSRHDG